MSEDGFSLGESQIEGARWFAVRSALKVEIKTGLKRSNRGTSTLALANAITGESTRNKRKAYKALDDYIAENIGEDFRRPLDS